MIPFLFFFSGLFGFSSPHSGAGQRRNVLERAAPLEIVLYVLHPKKVVFVLDAVVVKMKRWKNYYSGL